MLQVYVAQICYIYIKILKCKLSKDWNQYPKDSNESAKMNQRNQKQFKLMKSQNHPISRRTSVSLE